MGATLPIAETSANDEINRALNQKYRATIQNNDKLKIHSIRWGGGADFGFNLGMGIPPDRGITEK